MSTLKWFCFDLRVLVRQLTSPFGHPMQVSTQVQLAPTCDYLPVRLTRALQVCMFDRPLSLWVNLAVVETIHPCSNKLVIGVKIKAVDKSKLNQ